MMDILKSWQRFKIGLGLFAVGAALFIFTSSIHIATHYTSLALLLGGFAYAMFGYAGIFLNRFNSLKSKKPPPPF
ncbi:hypothetical protein [Alteromonas sp. KUL49]|uniref:hypothetical protein n=1 Tax=Alteromonas sp. KUL49 TaxID=2480798 RepID=UPI00102F1044|nr:hypothetical protein [Alteromonas sp. KUL49]TAP42165.1 hypothetical protein EYS00_00615 [Alteromonas sp. KUL49]